MTLQTFLKSGDFMWNDSDASQLTANNFSPAYGVNPSVSSVLKIFSVKRRNGRMRHAKV
jgi:hypothetical protein